MCLCVYRHSTKEDPFRKQYQKACPRRNTPMTPTLTMTVIDFNGCGLFWVDNGLFDWIWASFDGIQGSSCEYMGLLGGRGALLSVIGSHVSHSGSLF